MPIYRQVLTYSAWAERYGVLHIQASSLADPMKGWRLHMLCNPRSTCTNLMFHQAAVSGVRNEVNNSALKSHQAFTKQGFLSIKFHLVPTVHFSSRVASEMSSEPALGGRYFSLVECIIYSCSCMLWAFLFSI